LGDRLEGLYLYGSQARGDARPDSDIDVLVVVRGDFDYANLIDRTSETVSEISLEHDVVISRAFLSYQHFQHDQTPFLSNVRREAIAI
jgi:predicted nucleotidyltransferase